MTSASPTRTAQPGALLAQFGTHYRGLLRFLTRRTGCADTAQDLVHDAWVRLAEGEESEAAARQRGEQAVIAAPSDERAYLYTVAAHLASNWHRRERRGEERFVRDEQPDLLLAAACQGDVARAHVLREAVGAIEQALWALPERRRVIFLAHRLDGEPHDLLAQRHGVSVKTVEREVMQAMDAVREALLRWRGDGPMLAGAAGPARGRRKALSALLSLAGVGTAGAWAWRWWQHGVAQFELALATPRARLLRQALPDGSEITLDADTQAQVLFFGDRRVVALGRGSAFFAVARDATRPFIVETRLARITVLGTRFEAETEADEVRVAVESGTVRVQGLTSADAAPEVVLRAGERARIGAAGEVQRIATAGGGAGPGAAVAAWREGWLDFRGLALATAVQRLARYSDVPVHVADEVAALSVLGRVRISDAAQWLQLLPQMLPVRVRRAEDGRWEIRAGTKNP